MKTLQAATTQLEILDFEEGYIIGIETKKRKVSWMGKFYLRSLREKRRGIYESTHIK